MKISKKLLISIAILTLVALIVIITYIFYLSINTKKDYTLKETIISLIDKGAESSSKINIFIIARDSLEDDYRKIINEGKYNDLIKYIDLSIYKNPKYEFSFLNEKDDCILGYFSDKSDNINGTTYIRIDKLSGEIKELDNNLLKVSIY